MDHPFTSEVTTSPDGLTTIVITDQTSIHPTLKVFERSSDGQEVCLGSEECTFSLNKEQAFEALPYLINFLQTGRLVKR